MRATRTEVRTEGRRQAREPVSRSMADLILAAEYLG
jgi:hypothetical protein